MIQGIEKMFKTPDTRKTNKIILTNEFN